MPIFPPFSFTGLPSACQVVPAFSSWPTCRLCMLDLSILPVLYIFLCDSRRFKVSFYFANPFNCLCLCFTSGFIKFNYLLSESARVCNFDVHGTLIWVVQCHWMSVYGLSCHFLSIRLLTTDSVVQFSIFNILFLFCCSYLKLTSHFVFDILEVKWYYVLIYRYIFSIFMSIHVL